VVVQPVPGASSPEPSGPEPSSHGPPGASSDGPLVGRGPLGFGLVGCGAIAATYAAAFDGLEQARLVAVTDGDGALAARFAAEHGVAQADNLDELLAMPEVEAVCVLVPSGLHAEVGLAVAEAGKHVVVEKPIDISLDAARRLIDGAAARGVSLSVISQQRYNPGIQRAKALLASGRLGRVVEVWASVPWHRTQAYYDSGQWRGTWALDGGGALMNQAVHYADLVCWLCGPPQVISATCATLAHDIEVEDLALALLRFESGALGVLEASTVAFPGFSTTLRVSGTEGTIVLENGELVSASLQDGDERVMDGDVGALGFPGGHRAQLTDITSAIVEGRPQSVSGEDGYQALKFVLDVYEAAGWGPWSK
jgi:UDP-N-acetyl-2-amino-2-deoxyglucuronate dehydrogenase